MLKQQLIGALVALRLFPPTAEEKPPIGWWWRWTPHAGRRCEHHAVGCTLRAGHPTSCMTMLGEWFVVHEELD